MTDTTEPKPVVTQAEIDLAREGIEIHDIDAPEYIVCAALIRSAETVQQLQQKINLLEHNHKKTCEYSADLKGVNEHLQQRCDRLLAALKVAVSSVDNYATKGRIGCVMTSRKLAEIKAIIAEAEQKA